MISAAKDPEILKFMDELKEQGFTHRRLTVDSRRFLCLSVQHQKLKAFEEGAAGMYFIEAAWDNTKNSTEI